MSSELLKCWMLAVLNLAVLSSSVSRCMYVLIYSCHSAVSSPAYPSSFSSTHFIFLNFIPYTYLSVSIFSMFTLSSFILLSIHNFYYSLFYFSTLFSRLTFPGFFLLFHVPRSCPIQKALNEHAVDAWDSMYTQTYPLLKHDLLKFLEQSKAKTT
jgi:hypothetical protein